MRKAKSGGSRPAGYEYFSLVKEHLKGDLSKIFNGELVFPRQIEIHLPGNHRQPCNFTCTHCQGRQLDQSMGDYEEDALRIVDELEGRVPLFTFGGAYTEPFLNSHLLEFFRMVKKHGSWYGTHTNGSLLRTREIEESLLTEACQMATSKQDFISISLDAGTPESHMRVKNLRRNWFDEIIEGIRMAVQIRGDRIAPSIRVVYLLTPQNSSEDEIRRTIEIMQELKVDSLRFSIPYDLYGKAFSKVRKYKQDVEVVKDALFSKLLEPLMSKDLSERPFIFYLPPYAQDVDRMHFKQCIYSYFQITMGADGYVYKCSSTASTTFKMNRLGKIPHSAYEFNKMILANHDPEFCPSTCFRVGARCNRMAVEINAAWERIKGGRC